MSDESMEEPRDPFGFVDDGEETDEELEEEILDANGYLEADRFGMTADEERRGAPLDTELAAEEPEVWDGQDGPGPGDLVPEAPPGESEPDEAPPRP